jgi:hypothetical protein
LPLRLATALQVVLLATALQVVLRVSRQMEDLCGSRRVGPMEIVVIT